MCELSRVSRAGYYRYLAVEAPQQEEMATRAAMQEIFFQSRRSYGRRRMAHELRERGLRVNPKRVARLMREDNLLALQRRAYVVTTDSQHSLQVHLNVAARLELSGINQLWVADITYIRLRDEFIYLAVLLDRYSRRVVGWSLDRKLTVQLTLPALRQAIANRQPPPGLVHHSDRGIQYAAAEYVSVLQEHNIIASMSRPANPYDNAACERFMKTLKQEEIYCHVYRDLEDLRQNLASFLEQYYNRQRLHSALGYQSPEQFERGLAAAAPNSLGPILSFSRHGEIYRSDVGGKTS